MQSLIVSYEKQFRLTKENSQHIFSRELTEPRGVKLVFDVIQCNNPVARKALQFACGNALVCETAEDAKYYFFLIISSFRD
uniref:SMC hinge domain-containing protein n=1 Tax=Parascaris equorum TaxID=6256 RepID=A0A914R7L2_PAREQ